MAGQEKYAQKTMRNYADRKASYKMRSFYDILVNEKSQTFMMGWWA